MTFPENLGSQPGAAFDLAATAGTPISLQEAADIAARNSAQIQRSRLPETVRWDDEERPEDDPGGSTACEACGDPAMSDDDESGAMCMFHAVQVAMLRFELTAEQYGPTMAAVMLLTGLSADEIDAVGGVGA